MPVVHNNTVALIHIGSKMCIPGQDATISDEWMENDGVKAMIQGGALTVGEAAPPPPPVVEEPNPPNPPAPEQQKPPQVQKPVTKAT